MSSVTTWRTRKEHPAATIRKDNSIQLFTESVSDIQRRHYALHDEHFHYVPSHGSRILPLLLMICHVYTNHTELMVWWTQFGRSRNTPDVTSRPLTMHCIEYVCVVTPIPPFKFGVVTSINRRNVVCYEKQRYIYIYIYSTRNEEDITVSRRAICCCSSLCLSLSVYEEYVYCIGYV